MTDYNELNKLYYKFIIGVQTPNDRKTHTVEIYAKNAFDATLDVIELLQTGFDQDFYGDRLQPLYTLDSFGKYFDIDTLDFIIEQCDKTNDACPFNLFEDLEKEPTKIGHEAFNEFNYEHLISYHEQVDVKNKTMYISCERPVKKSIKEYVKRYCLRKYGFTADIY